MVHEREKGLRCRMYEDDNESCLEGIQRETIYDVYFTHSSE
jgi:hypothetical protein